MERNLMPPGEHVVDYVVSPYSEEMMPHALRVARALRQAGKTVDVAPEAFKKVQKAFKYADKAGARRIAFVAPGEWEVGKVRIKDLRTGDAENRPQVDVPLVDLANVDKYFETA